MRELEHPLQSVPKDKRFCTLCGEIKRLRYFEGDSSHCSACCEKMLHTHVRLWSLPVVLVMLAAVAAAVYLAVQTVPLAQQIRRADISSAEGRLDEACELYAGVLDASGAAESLLPTECGIGVWEKYASVYAAVYSEYEAAMLFRNTLPKAQIAASQTLSGLEEARAAYDETMQFVQTLNEKYAFETAQDMPYDDVMRELQAFADESDSRYIKGYVAYYKASATAFYKQDDPMAANVYYNEMLELLPDEYMTVYIAQGSIAMAAGAYDKAVAAYEALLQKNSGYTDGWTRLAEAARLAGDREKSQNALDHLPQGHAQTYRTQVRMALLDDDLTKAQELCGTARAALSEKADKIFTAMLADRTISNEDAQFLTNYVIFNTVDAAVSLLSGDTDAAITAAYEHGFNYAYYLSYISGDSSALTQPVINMASLCAALAENDEALQTIAQFGECDEATQQIIDGKLTLRDVFVEGKAEIL